MGNFHELFAKYDWLNDGVYQIELSDPVEGGPDGTSNRQARQLTHRTRDLNNRMEELILKLDELKGGSLGTGYNTMLKLQNKLRTVETAIYGTNGDALIETLQEALDFINEHKADIDSLVTTYLKKSSIADNLTTSDSTFVLSAAQGKELKDLHDAMATIVEGKETPAGAQLKASAAMSDANDYTNKRIYYDLIVDSNEALAMLNNHPTAFHVLVKAGTWTANTQINIHGNCQMIYGEPGSKIIVNTNALGSENMPVSALYTRSVTTKLVNVTAQITSSVNPAYLAVFNGFVGMENCVAIAKPAFAGYFQEDTVGFYNCLNLTGCRVECTATFQYDFSPKALLGFKQCRNLIQCSAKVFGNVSVSGLENEIFVYGFFECDFLTNCDATVNDSEGNLFDATCFKLCNFLNNCNGFADSSGIGARVNFEDCYFLNNCSGTVTMEEESVYPHLSFYECQNVTFCRGVGSDFAQSAFKNCYYVLYCLAKKVGFTDCYSGPKNGSMAANTAEGGYNRIE